MLVAFVKIIQFWVGTYYQFVIITGKSGLLTVHLDKIIGLITVKWIIRIVR